MTKGLVSDVQASVIGRDLRTTVRPLVTNLRRLPSPSSLIISPSPEFVRLHEGNISLHIHQEPLPVQQQNISDSGHQEHEKLDALVLGE